MFADGLKEIIRLINNDTIKFKKTENIQVITILNNGLQSTKYFSTNNKNQITEYNYNNELDKILNAYVKGGDNAIDKDKLKKFLGKLDTAIEYYQNNPDEFDENEKIRAIASMQYRYGINKLFSIFYHDDFKSGQHSKYRTFAPPDKKQGQGLKMLTPKQMLSRLPILLAQVHAGNNSQKLKNEIRQLIYSLCKSKKISKTVDNKLIATI